MGGPTPAEPPRGRIRPPREGVPRASGIHRQERLWVPWEPWAMDPRPCARQTESLWGWPQGPWPPPLLGGGDTLARGSRGCISTRVFPGNPPRMPPPHSRGSTMNPLFSRVLLVILVPIFTDFSDFLGRILLPCCYSTCMLIFLVDSSSRGIATSDA